MPFEIVESSFGNGGFPNDGDDPIRLDLTLPLNWTDTVILENEQRVQDF